MTRTRMLTIQHNSLLVFDSARNKRRDARKVFTTGADIITGTEAGIASAPTPGALHDAARDAGYILHLPHPQDSWVAVAEDLIAPDLKGRRRIADSGLIKHVPSAKQAGDPNGPYGAKGLPWLAVESVLSRRITTGAGHWLTKGRTEDQTPKGPLNHYRINKRIAKEVGEWAEEHGAGKDIVFYGADTNIVDKHSDVFRGVAPMTTCWDEVQEWPGTGHGNIDIIASYDKDRAVQCVSARAWNDREFHLNTDHFMITARYRVTLPDRG